MSPSRSTRTLTRGAAFRLGPILAPVLLLLPFLLRPSVLHSSASANPDYRNFEGLHVHPLALTPDGTRLLALNTPDARLEIFSVGGGALTSLGEVPVGLEPVSVRAENDSIAWVVNHVSDDVSVVNLNTMHVVATLRVGDEPTDVAFAGAPLKAFVCVSGEDVVKAYDPATLAPAFGSPTAILGRHPRALAVGGTGASEVYVGVLDAGNRTTILSAQAVAALGGPSPPDPPKDSGLPAAPAVGVIVQWDGGNWVDDGKPAPKIWDAGIPAGFTLADWDVAVVDAGSGAVTRTVSDVGTNIFNIGVDAGTGTLYVANTEAFNRIRFEPNARGRFAQDRVTLLASGGAGAVTPVHLNTHIDYDVSPGDLSEREQSLALPTDVLVNSAASKVYVAATGSNKVGVLDLAGGVTNRIDVSTPGTPKFAAGVPRGPSGLAYDATNDQLFVMNRFTNTISILDAATETKTDEVELKFDPSPVEVTAGRRFLYDAMNSAHGDLACATCHIGGNFDNIAWDLGDPRAAMQPNPQLPTRAFHPMKGPMATQTLRGLLDISPFHWRGDRADFMRFNPAFIGLMGAPDSLSTADMQAMSDFIMTIAFGPNPNQRLDRSFSALADSGRVEFSDRPHDGGQTCAFCHTLPAGTNRTIIPGPLLQESQDFKVPQLRNMYQKSGFARTSGSHQRGYGYLHDGSVDNLVNFLRASVFNFPDTMARYELEAFLLSFDTGLAPSVGRQLTINGATKHLAGTTDLLDSLYAQADLGNCDLIAHGRIGGVLKGFLYRGAHLFISDHDAEGSIDADSLRSWAENGGEITYLGVPPGAGRRMGIDRDRDGYLDRWEIALGSDPADAASVPSVTSTEGGAAPFIPRLLQNRPNPFNPETVIPFDTGPGGRVTLRVFDAQGRLVRTLVDATLPPGIRAARWNGLDDRGRPAASGRYFSRLQVGSTLRARTMTLVR